MDSQQSCNIGIISISFKDKVTGTSLRVQWLRLYTFNAGSMDLIPGRKLGSHMQCGSQNNNDKK